MNAVSPERVLFVLGIHRSGTSALCAALERCGAVFGTDLLDPMAGVNDEGFWEDTRLVQVNEQLLQHLGTTWYALPPGMDHVDWSADALASLQQAAQDVLRQGLERGSLPAFKDPRLCITLPFWLLACDALQVAASVCVISRAPLEVARSLQKRDGFPLGYGLRLYASYRRLMALHLPPDAQFVTYDALLQDTQAVVRSLADRLPLRLPAEGFDTIVKPRLRHHAALDGPALLLQADDGQFDMAALVAAIDQAYPVDEVLRELADGMVDRAGQLTTLGEYHSRALATLAQRDSDVEEVSALHRTALATIDERDAQIVELDQRLTATGEHLGEALDRLNLIQRVMARPIIGHLFRALVKYESR